jgi:four helix bundle protein
MKSESIIADKSYAFALRTVKLYKYMCDDHHEYTLSKQVLKSGTSIGANVEEGLGGQSIKDFIAKFHISYKEARETRYWLRLLRDSQYVEEKLPNSLIVDGEELLKILNSILVTTKNKLNAK